MTKFQEDLSKLSKYLETSLIDKYETILNKKSLEIPAYVKFLNYFGLDGFIVYQNNKHDLDYSKDSYGVKDYGVQNGMCAYIIYQNRISGSSVKQRFIKTVKFYQNEIEFNILDQDEIIFKELFQKNIKISSLNQSGMKGKHADQSGSAMRWGVSQDLIEVGILDHSGFKSPNTFHVGAKIGTLITDSETEYGNWDLKNATIDSWQGDGIKFDTVDITYADLPENLMEAIKKIKG